LPLFYIEDTLISNQFRGFFLLFCKKLFKKGIEIAKNLIL